VVLILAAILPAALALALGAAQTPPAGDASRLARIRAQMRRSLSELPNFTCLQTIERQQRAPRSRTVDVSDTVRLEVAQVGSKELFSWPGAERFEDKDINDIVGEGMTGTGDFALLARNLFLTTAAVITYAGDERLDGRPAVRYDYRISLSNYGYKIIVDGVAAVVPYGGSFWIESETLDLLRLTQFTDQVPDHLGVAEVSNEIRYAKAPLAGRTFLLPRSAESGLKFFSGAFHVNRVVFSNCRQYSANTSISFDTTPDRPSASETIAAGLDLPPGLSIETRLETPIDSRDAAVGDPITARLTRDLKIDGRVIAPKDAALSGRIRRLVRYRAPSPYVEVGLYFSELRFGDTRAPLSAELEEIGSLETLLGASARFTPPRRDRWRQRIPVTRQAARPGVGILFLSGARAALPKGFQMIWKTTAPVP